MSVKVSFKSNLRDYRARVDQMAKQTKFATAVALNRTAVKVKDAQVREMRDVFDRPTPFTLSQVRISMASKTDLKAVVSLESSPNKGIPAAQYLLSQITGGVRKMKRFERALQSIGALPHGYRVVPGEAAKVDAYGNLDRGQIVQILSYFKAFPEAGYKENMTDKRRKAMAKGSKTRLGYEYFVGRPGDRLPLGVWQRVRFASGSAVRPILIFVPSTVYQAVFDFQYTGKVVMKAEFDKQFRRAFAEAMASAR